MRLTSFLRKTSSRQAAVPARSSLHPNPQRLLSPNSPPVLLRRQPRHYTTAAATTATSTTAASSQHCYERAQQLNNDGNSFRWLMAMSAAVATGLGVAGMVPPTISMCEEASEENTEQPVDKQEEEDEEDEKWVIGPDDPYYTVPDKDEPTDCQMCLTFRQGPCRLDWKRFELCVKDNDPTPKPSGEETPDKKEETTASGSSSNPNNNEGATACMKYAMPFYMCSHKHVNTYLILGNEQTEKTVMKPLLESYNSEEAQSRRLCWPTSSAIKVNWDNWDGFVKALYDVGGYIPTRFSLDKTGFSSAAEALKAMWDDKDGNQYLMMTDEGVPYLISVQADIPKQNDNISDDTILFMAFALDQNGNLIGDARNKDFDEKKEKDSESSTHTSSETPTEMGAAAASAVTPSTTVDLQIQLVPGVTETFTVYGLYVPKDGDFLDDGILFESKPYSLERMTKKATKKAKKLAKQKSSKGAADKNAKTVAKE